ncbi:MAG: response regulator transcription factor [Gammaproteobacteria bacterium]|nr:response regulator transcription factor [Gammaproteobacteria bacterium]
MHVLLIEDDTVLVDSLTKLLSGHGHSVTAVTDIPEARCALPQGHFDAVVLDLNLPRGDGMDLLKSFRTVFERVPVLVLTGRTDLANKLRAFNMGADDYLAKPFEFAELRARLGAICRRYRERSEGLIAHGGIVLDVEGQTATVDGKPLPLSMRELSILRCLLESRGKVVSRPRLEENLYGLFGAISSNAVEVHIHNLRKKIPADTIKTVHGLGYTVESRIG